VSALRRSGRHCEGRVVDVVANVASGSLRQVRCLTRHGRISLNAQIDTRRPVPSARPAAARAARVFTKHDPSIPNQETQSGVTPVLLTEAGSGRPARAARKDSTAVGRYQ